MSYSSRREGHGDSSEEAGYVPSADRKQTETASEAGLLNFKAHLQ